MAGTYFDFILFPSAFADPASARGMVAGSGRVEEGDEDEEGDRRGMRRRGGCREVLGGDWRALSGV
jgi:hypothetical protein